MASLQVQTIVVFKSVGNHRTQETVHVHLDGRTPIQNLLTRFYPQWQNKIFIFRGSQDGTPPHALLPHGFVLQSVYNYLEAICETSKSKRKRTTASLPTEVPPKSASNAIMEGFVHRSPRTRTAARSPAGHRGRDGESSGPRVQSGTSPDDVEERHSDDETRGDEGDAGATDNADEEVEVDDEGVDLDGGGDGGDGGDGDGTFSGGDDDDEVEGYEHAEDFDRVDRAIHEDSGDEAEPMLMPPRQRRALVSTFAEQQAHRSKPLPLGSSSHVSGIRVSAAAGGAAAAAGGAPAPSGHQVSEEKVEEVSKNVLQQFRHKVLDGLTPPSGAADASSGGAPASGASGADGAWPKIVVDAVVFTAMVEELADVIEALRDAGASIVDKWHQSGFRYVMCTLKAVRFVVLCANHMGTEHIQPVVIFAWTHFQFTLAVLIGLSGGIKQDRKIGDVVYSTSVSSLLESSVVGAQLKATSSSDSSTSDDVLLTLKLQANKVSLQTHLSSGLLQSLNISLAQDTNLADQIKQNMEDALKGIVVNDRVSQQAKLFLQHSCRTDLAFEWRKQAGLFSSGFKIKTKDWSLYLPACGFRDTVAVDMESFGFVVATLGLPSPVNGLVIRGISDLADSLKEASDAPGLRRAVMKNATALLVLVLKSVFNAQEAPESDSS